jgi:hypothetical protein
MISNALDVNIIRFVTIAMKEAFRNPYVCKSNNIRSIVIY